VTVGLRELRENLKTFIDRAKAGEEVVITDRGRPVARIIGAEAQTTFERLVAEGRIRPALGPKTPLRDPAELPRARGEQWPKSSSSSAAAEPLRRRVRVRQGSARRRRFA
jgi:prevent-host-death family protein